MKMPLELLYKNTSEPLAKKSLRFQFAPESWRKVWHADRYP